ncbi:MAG: hypothetical protein ACOX75_01215 [Lachnospiraceae bacterium]|jgi:hypothetical protein
MNSDMEKLSQRISKPVFYILSFTWGGLFTFTGALFALVLRLTGHKPAKWGWCWYFECGKKQWGGAERGIFFIKDRCGKNERLMNHEFGHALQNCIFGPFMVFLVALPSTCRYWVRRIMVRFGKQPKKPYDSIWFEEQATRIGTAKMKQLRKEQAETEAP